MIHIPTSSPHKFIVVDNTARPESELKKRSNSGCHYEVCESVAMGESLVGCKHRKENVADFMTNVFYVQKKKYLVSNFLHDTISYKH